MATTITTDAKVTYTNRRGEVLTGTVLAVHPAEVYGQPMAQVEFEEGTTTIPLTKLTLVADDVPAGERIDIDDTRGELIEHVEEWGKAGPQLWVRMKGGAESWIDIRSNLADQLYAHPELGAKARARATDNVHQEGGL